MNLFGFEIRRVSSGATATPRAATQPADGGVILTTSQQIEEALRAGAMTAAGESVTPETAMRVAAVFACIRIISGAVGNLPLDIKRREDERTRLDASEHWAWRLLRRKPNRWMKPAQFRKMLTAHLLHRGRAYAVKVKGVRGDVQALIPLHPDRVSTRQKDDLSLEHRYTRPDGRVVVFQQDEILYMTGLTLDGVNGVSVITYARETIGMQMAVQRHGAKYFKNSTTIGAVLKSDKTLGQDGIDNLSYSIEKFRGSENAYKTLVLEQGVDYVPVGMSAEDAQFIQTAELGRADIAMFFGVPPHMIGATEKTTSWGSGIEQQSIGFTTYTLEDWLTTWEEAINADVISDAEPDVYARHNRAALVRGDIKTRWEAHTKALQWGVLSPNEVRALEDQNPRAGGDIFYPPPNTAGSAEPLQSQADEVPNEPA